MIPKTEDVITSYSDISCWDYEELGGNRLEVVMERRKRERLALHSLECSGCIDFHAGEDDP